MSSWKDGTKTRYATYISRWILYCNRLSTDPFNTSVHTALNFLADQYHTQDLGYSAVNTARSALSAILTLTDSPGVTFGSHKLVARFMKGIFVERPSLPRYSVTWDVDIVLDYLKTISINDISLNMLTKKLALLLALCSAQRVQTIKAIKLSQAHITESACIFYLDSVLKTTTPRRHQSPLEFSLFCEANLCIVRHVNMYIDMTKNIRGGSDQLLISYVTPYKPVSRDTIARWLKCMLTMSGVDTKVFSAHSTRSAATSKMHSCGEPIDLILKSAGWSTESTFAKFYKRSVTVTRSFSSDILEQSTEKK